MYNNTIKYHTPFDAKKARKERAANFFGMLMSGLTLGGIVVAMLFYCAFT